MSAIIEQYMAWIIGFIFAIIFVLVIYKIYKFHKLIEYDRLYKKYNDNGQIIEETRTRNIWDYNFFPGLSKVWHFSGWQFLVAILILLFVILMYAFTKDEKLFDILGLNLGVILGMMIRHGKQ